MPDETDTRTPEQKAADEQLTAAIEANLHAYRADRPASVLSEYVVLAASHRWNDDGEPVTSVATIYRDGDVPWHRAMGLVELARTRMKAEIAADIFE